MMIDSFQVIKRPLISCMGCDRVLRSGRDDDGIVVLEYTPTSTLLFLCHGCASNRIILDHLAERLAKENVDKEE